MCTTGYVILLHEERHQKTTTVPCCFVKINMYNANVHVHTDMYLRGVSIYNVHVHVYTCTYIVLQWDDCVCVAT